MAAKRSQRISSDMMRKFQLIDALSKYSKPSTSDLHDITQIPVSTIKRQIRALRTEFGMRILFIRDPNVGDGANSGYYMLADWGIIDRDSFIQHYKRLKPQNSKIRPVERDTQAHELILK